MHKTKYRKTTRARPPWVKSDPREGKSKFLEKRLSPTAQNGCHQQHKTVVTNSTKRLSPTAQNGYHQQHKTVITNSTKPPCRPRGHLSLQSHEGWGHIDPGWPFEG